MRLARVTTADGIRPVAERAVDDLRTRLADLERDLDPRATAAWLDSGDLPTRSETALDFAVPVARVGAVAIGLNYAAHVPESGDVVLTGTPEGVALSGSFPYLHLGDVVRLEIEGLGEQVRRMIGGSATR